MASFIFFDDYATALAELSDKSRLKVYDALCDYAFKKTEPDLHGESKAVFALIKREIDEYNKRVENGKKGGRKKSIVKPHLNQGSTTLNENYNQGSSMVLRESPPKESPDERSPLNEKERSKEKENIFPQESYPQENTPQETVQRTCARVGTDGRTVDNRKQREFFELYPKINIDNYSPSEYAGIDFELLMRRFEESSFLRSRQSFSWICKNYPKIAAGEYKDFDECSSGGKKTGDTEDMGYNGWNFFKRVSEQLKEKEKIENDG